MPIVLKYGAPGPILAAGYAAGVGQRQNAQQHDLLGLWQQGQQQQFQAVQNYLGRQQQQQLQSQAFTQQAQKNRLGQQFQAGQRLAGQGFQADQATLQRNFQEGQLKTQLDARSKELEANRQQQMMHDFDTQALAGLRRGELELPPAAQKRLDQLDAGLVDAMKLSPAEQDQFYKKYQDEKRSLLRTAQPAKQLPYEERLQKAIQSVPEEHRNQPWQLNKDNELVLPSGYKMSDPAAEQAKLADKYHASNDKYTEQLQKEAQRLSDANVPAKGQASKPWTDYVDQAKKNLETIGRTAPQMPQHMQPAETTTQPVQPVSNPPPGTSSPQAMSDPQAVQTYNQMQAQLAAGLHSWTIGGDSPSGKGEMTSMQDRWGLGDRLGVSAPFVGQKAAQQPSAAAAPASSDDFTNKWKTLKTGESLMGPDGKLYIKR